MKTEAWLITGKWIMFPLDKNVHAVFYPKHKN